MLRFPWHGSLATRLRCYLLAIAAALVGLSAIGAHLVARDKADFDRTIAPLVNTFTGIEGISTVMRDLSLLAELIGRGGGDRPVVDLAEQVRARMNTSAETGWLADADAFAALRRSAETLPALAARYMQATEQRRDLEERWRDTAERILSALDEVRNDLEPPRTRAAMQLERAMTTDGWGGRADPLTRGYLWWQDVSTQVFGLRLAAQVLVDMRPDQGATVQMARLGDGVTELAIMLARLTPTDEVSGIALHLSGLQADLSGPDGLAPLLVREGKLVRRLADVREDLLAHTHAMLAQLEALTSQSTEAVVAAGQRLSKATGTAQYRSLLLDISVGLVLLVLMWRGIEVQLARRMSSLSRSMDRISQGEMDFAVPITGFDEIGRMEGALGELQKTARDLRRTNEDMEEFAYIASHDLRAPLRAIHDLAEWSLEEDEGLPEDARTRLVLIVERSRKLMQMLEDLLGYAKAGQSRDMIGMLDLEALARDLEDLHQNGGFTVRYSGPAEIRCYRTPVTTIVTNLLSNAIKHHDRPGGTISICAAVDDDRIRLCVADDGPGIAQEDHERIFRLFHTLSTGAQTRGSGMGLALVQKLALRMGGAVTVDSDPTERRGTTFRVVLPRP